jgi:hypothetical protein
MSSATGPARRLSFLDRYPTVGILVPMRTEHPVAPDRLCALVGRAPAIA